MPTLVVIRRKMLSLQKRLVIQTHLMCLIRLKMMSTWVQMRGLQIWLVNSGSSFWNVGSSSTSTTPIVEKFDKTEKLIIDEKITLVDDEGKPLENIYYLGNHDSEDQVKPDDNEMSSFLTSNKVGYGTSSLLKQWRKTYENVDYDYDSCDDDMYEGQKIPDNIQPICGKLDIK
ncbi:hypothetical protein Tco_0239340, partial [Tanacetum coccineum]